MIASVLGAFCKFLVILEVAVSFCTFISVVVLAHVLDLLINEEH